MVLRTRALTLQILLFFYCELQDTSEKNRSVANLGTDSLRWLLHFTCGEDQEANR